MVAGFTVGLPPGLAYFSWRAMPMVACTPLGKTKCASLRLSSSDKILAPVFFATACATLIALPSMVKSMSSIGKPPNMSRIAPPVKNTFRLAFVAAAWISETSPALVGAQVALEHKHVIAHRFALSSKHRAQCIRRALRPRAYWHSLESVQALG